MSNRISTGLGGTFNKNRQKYYNYCNSLIEGMRSGGISEGSINNAFKQYNEDCNVYNTYYCKFAYGTITYIYNHYRNKQCRKKP